MNSHQMRSSAHAYSNQPGFSPYELQPTGVSAVNAVAGMVPVPAEFRRVGHPHLEGTGVNFHQSFSGSETDVSTSTENLTPEEQYFLRHTQRQDPPGEENIHQQYHNLQRHLTHAQQPQIGCHTAQISHVSAASSACGRSYDSSSCNTMIVHSDSTLDEKFLNEYIYNSSASQRGTPAHSSAATSAVAANPSIYSTQQVPSFRQPPPYSSVVSSASGSVQQLASAIVTSPTTATTSTSSSAYHSQQVGRAIGAGNSDPLYSNVGEALAQAQNKSILNSSGAYATNLDSSMQEINDIPSRYLDKSQVLKHLAKEVRGPLIGASSNPGSSSHLHLLSLNSSSVSDRGLSTEEKIKLLEGISSNQQFLDQYHQQQQLLHAHHQQHQQLHQQATELPPPPAYPASQNQQASQLRQNQMPTTGGNFQLPPPPPFSVNAGVHPPHVTVVSNSGGSHGGSSVSLSRSQPDLTKVETSKTSLVGISPEEFRSKLSVGKVGGGDAASSTSVTSWRTSDSGFTAPINDSASDAKEILDILCQENAMLRLDLDTYHRKMAKFHKFEQELAKVRSSHEALVESSERRENLEKTARQKLQMEVRRLQTLHRLASDQLDVALAQLNRRDGANVNSAGPVIAQIIAQNRELRATKERQEVELAAQRDTLQEQRQHIDILDSALTNAQANVVRLEEECRKRQGYAEKVSQLERALSSLQSSSEKREQMLMKFRQQQEREIQELKGERVELLDALTATRRDLEKLKQEETQQRRNRGGDAEADGDVIDNPVDAELRRAKNRITLLEAEVAMWEQRFLGELRENRAQSANPETHANKPAESLGEDASSGAVSHVRSHSQSQTSAAFSNHRGSADAISSFLLRKGHLVAKDDGDYGPSSDPLSPSGRRGHSPMKGEATTVKQETTPMRKSADLGQVSAMMSSSAAGGSVVRNRVRDLNRSGAPNVVPASPRSPLPASSPNASGSRSLSTLDLNSSSAVEERVPTSISSVVSVPSSTSAVYSPASADMYQPAKRRSAEEGSSAPSSTDEVNTSSASLGVVMGVTSAQMNREHGTTSKTRTSSNELWMV